MATESTAAQAQSSWLDRQRFRPQQWSSRPRWRTYEVGNGERWFGFGAVRDLAGLPPEILMVPLVGHTLGHAGIAVQGRDHWILMAGDAYFDQGEMDLEHPHCLPGLRAYQWMMDKDRGARITNQRRLRELRRDHPDVAVMCSHDPALFERLAQRRLDAPAVPVRTSLPVIVDAQPITP